jgi:hypothetical protein
MRTHTAMFTMMMAFLPGVAAADTTFEPLPPTPSFEPLYSQQAARPAKVTTPRAMVADRTIVPPARAVPPTPALGYYRSPTAAVQSAGAAPLPTPVAVAPRSFVRPAPVQALDTPFVLPGNTAIALRLQSALSSRETQRGETVQLVVDRDVMIDGRVVVPRGTPATGAIVRASGSGGFGKGGKIEIAATTLMLNGHAVGLAGTLLTKGRGGSFGKMLLFGALTGAMGVASVRGDDAIVGADAILAATTRVDVAFK